MIEYLGHFSEQPASFDLSVNKYQIKVPLL